MSLLKIAVKARIPLIGISTDDPRGAGVVVDAILGIDVKIVKPGSKGLIAPQSVLTENDVGIAEWTEDQKWPEIGRWLEEKSCSLLVVNPLKPHPWIMDLGAIEVPVALLKDFIGNYTDANPQAFIPALTGLSLMNVDRICKMAMAASGEFTPKAIRDMRRQFFQTSRGLEELETTQLFYEPSHEVAEWLTLEGRLFKADTHPLLTPRGFLFSGPPGTGKTSGAMFIADKLGVPLYRLDIGMILSRWMGESDARLLTALKQVDTFEPCVLLLDEVEKLFEVSDSSGVLPRLLSALLWWLQNHKSKVFVIMTTNNAAKIPPELYRPGRVDRQVVFIGLLQTQLLPFIMHLATRLSGIAKLPAESLKALAKTIETKHPTGTISQADVTEQVLRLVKLQVLKHKPGDSSG